MKNCRKKNRGVRCLVVEPVEGDCATEWQPGMVIMVSPLRYELLLAEGKVKPVG